MGSSKFINQEMYMLYLVCVITAWQRILPQVTVTGFKKCCISNTVEGTDGDMLWNDREEDGDVRTEYEEGEGTDCEDGDSDMNGKGR